MRFGVRSIRRQEAIDERHLPTLVQLLTLDNSHLVDRDRAFALFMDLANSPEILATVARKSSILSASQFDELIKRILASPGCGNEAVTVLSKVNRLTEEHRRELRAKVFREASLAVIANNATALRISDAEIAQLASTRACLVGANARSGRTGPDKYSVRGCRSRPSRKP